MTSKTQIADARVIWRGSKYNTFLVKVSLMNGEIIHGIRRIICSDYRVTRMGRSSDLYSRHTLHDLQPQQLSLLHVASASNTMPHPRY
jgi:hypothetical protein